MSNILTIMIYERQVNPMIEKRKLYSDDLRKLCIRHNWYTKGTNEEYAQLLNMADKLDHVRSRYIVGIAEDIIKHSDLSGTDYDLPAICFEIAEICHSFFEQE